VDALWHDKSAWWRCSVLNTAHMHWFSSDRAAREYMERVWRIGT
jgi:starch phosphorylase